MARVTAAQVAQALFEKVCEPMRFTRGRSGALQSSEARVTQQEAR